MSNFKPCPFCGSHMLSIEHVYPAWGGDKKEPHVVCDDCAASSPVYIWDARKSDQAVARVPGQKHSLSCYS